MAAVSTPRCAQRTIPATKRLHGDSPASLSPNIKPKSKRKKEEERKDQEISLNDIFALIKEMQADIKTKYQVIEEKVRHDGEKPTGQIVKSGKENDRKDERGSSKGVWQS